MADSAYSWTPFRYGFNNPLKFSDPTGMLEDIDIYTSPTDTDPIIVLETDKIIGEIFLSDKPLPADVLKGGVTLTFDIDKFIPNEIPDAFVLSIGGMAGLGYGFTGSFDFAMINKGEDSGKIFVYSSFGQGGGAGYGYGISFGNCDYNESSGVPFNRNIFRGTSREITGSIGLISETRVTGFADGEFHLNPFTRATKSYESLLFGVGKGTPASFGIYKTDTNVLSEVGKFKLNLKP